MALKEGDLKDTMLKRLSFDEYEPKTGDEKDVAVLGFFINTESAGRDLYNFLGSSVVENRDLEVSPNPDTDGYHMVFVELDRNEDLVKNINSIVNEVERLAGNLNWEVKTPYIDEPVSITEIESIVQMDPESYLTASDYKDKLEAELDKANLESNQPTTNDQIMEFLSNSNLINVDFSENIVSLQDARTSQQLEVISYGNGPDVLEQLGIKESAVKLEYDHTLFNKLKYMLGEMKAVPIDNYIVIYDPAHTDILVTKTC